VVTAREAASRVGPDPIAELLARVVAGEFPPADGDITVVPPDRTTGHHPVLCFTGHAVVSTTFDLDAVRAFGADGYGGAHAPDVLRALAGPDGWIGVLDATLFALGTGTGSTLMESDDYEGHHRVEYARSVRGDVRVLANDLGLVTLGTGVGGRIDLGFELLAEEDRGSGHGRRLVTDALAMVAAGEPVWASSSPGNARSLRSLIGARFTLVGSEVIISPGAG